jgi:hypothetical protein
MWQRSNQECISRRPIGLGPRRLPVDHSARTWRTRRSRQDHPRPSMLRSSQRTRRERCGFVRGSLVSAYHSGDPLGCLPSPERFNLELGSCYQPMSSFSARTASPPPPSRSSAGSRASSRQTSMAPRTTSGPGPPAWLHQPGCTTNSYSSINPSSANAIGSFTPPTNGPLPGSRLSC